MPPRRRGEGSPRGSLPAAVRTALEEEAQRLRDLADPVDTIRGVRDAFAAMEVELGRLATVRLEAISALREQGWSYDRIAASTGLSKGRVAQLAWELRRRQEQAGAETGP